jgi:hypothetical protein
MSTTEAAALKAPRQRGHSDDSYIYRDIYRGVCPVCRREIETRRDGRMASHRSKGTKCDGSGRSPIGGRRAPETPGPVILPGGLPGQGKH